MICLALRKFGEIFRMIQNNSSWSTECSTAKRMNTSGILPPEIHFSKMVNFANGLEQTALQSGANAFIAKPFEIDEVMDQLHKLTT